MADTDIDAVRKQKKEEYDKQYRLKRKLLLQLPKTYTWSGTFILKDGRYRFFYPPIYVLVSLMASFPQAFLPTPCAHLYPPP
jgi:hypothetical protein